MFREKEGVVQKNYGAFLEGGGFRIILIDFAGSLMVSGPQVTTMASPRSRQSWTCGSHCSQAGKKQKFWKNLLVILGTFWRFLEVAFSGKPLIISE